MDQIAVTESKYYREILCFTNCILQVILCCYIHLIFENINLNFLN